MSDDLRILKPTYSIRRYTDQIYKVTKFKSQYVGVPLTDSKHYDEKLDNSLSRSRASVLELALCNPWKWFVTLTIDPKNFPRNNLSFFYKSFTQWLRDRRKKGFSCAYLLVPELHEDKENWHLHGFLNGDFSDLIPFSKVDFRVKRSLIDGGFYNWPSYQSKFGFCSFGLIRSPVRSAFYISKYITKDHDRLVSSLGANVYYCSRGLNRSIKQSEIYGSSSFLDGFLTSDYDFCKVGMTKVSDNLNWSFALDMDDGAVPFESWEPLFDLPDMSLGLSDGLSSINQEYEQFDFFSISGVD